MAITLTTIHKQRVAKQVMDNLVGLQRDMVRNAQAHKAMALAANPPVATLRTFVNDAAAAYLNRLQWVIDLRNDPVKRQKLLDAIAAMGVPEADVISMVTELRSAAIGLRDAGKANYAAIVTACDALLAAVDPVDSLWPE